MRMPKAIVFRAVIALIIIIVSSNMLLAQEKPRIGVLRFTSSVEDVFWYGSRVADELQDMLANTIAQSPLNTGSASANIETIKTGDAVSNQLTGVNYAENDKARIKKILNELNEFNGLVGVKITGYNKDTGKVLTSVLFYDLEQATLKFMKANFIVKSGNRKELQAIGDGIGNRLSRMIFSGK